MAIIYSYPSETNIQSTDLLVGTSTVVTNGVSENVTRSFSVANLTAKINTLISAITSITFTSGVGDTAAPFLVNGASGGTITSTGTVGMTKSGISSSGWLSTADWNNFNDKLSIIGGTIYSIPIFSSATALGSSSLTEPIGNYIYSDKHFAPKINATAGQGWDLGATGLSWKNAFIDGTLQLSQLNLSGRFFDNTGTSPGTAGQVLSSTGTGVAWINNQVGDITAIDTNTPSTLSITNGTGPGTVTIDTTVATITGAGTAALASGAQIVSYVATQGYGAGTVESFGAIITGIPALTASVSSPTFAPVLTIDVANQGQGATSYLDGTGNWTIPAGAGSVTQVTSSNTNTISVASGITTPVLTAVTGVVNSTSTNLATGTQIQTAINDALVGFLEFKSGFNATTGAITSGGNLTAAAGRVAIAIGDFYVVTVAGNFYGDASEFLEIGDQVICQTAAAADSSTIAMWVAVQNNTPSAGKGSAETNTIKGIAGFDNQMFNVDNGFVTSTTLNSIIVTVVDTDPGAGVINKYFVEGVQQANISLGSSSTFYINQDDASNNGHPLVLSTAAAADPKAVYNTGVVYLLNNVDAGSASAYDTGFNAAVGNRGIRVTLTQTAPTLSYACYIHSGMGADVLQTKEASTTKIGLGRVTSSDSSVSISYSNGIADFTGVGSGAGTVTNVAVTNTVGFTTTVADPTGSAVISLSVDGTGTSGQFLDYQGNWATPAAGAGTVTTTATTTSGTIPILSGTTSITNSLITASGSIYTLAGTFKPTQIQDTNSSPGAAGELLSSTGTGLDWIPAPVGYSGWTISDGSNTTLVASTDTVTFATGNATALSVVESNKTLTYTSNAFGGGANVGHVPDASGGTDTTKFLKGDGTWAAAGGGITKLVVAATGNGTQTVFTAITTGLTLPASYPTFYIDIYISGVYQQKSTYAYTTATNGTVTFVGGTPPNGASIEFVTTV